MRKEFVEGTLKQARTACPWAEKFAKAVSGYWCFESLQDYYVWRNQK